MKKQSASRNGATRQAKAELLLAEALDRILAGQPPPYGRTWTTCLRIKRFLKEKEGAQLETTQTRQAKLNMNTQTRAVQYLHDDADKWHNETIKLTAQRDELLAALKPLLNAYVGAIGIADPADDALCLNASCAIAKAESNQT